MPSTTWFFYVALGPAAWVVLFLSTMMGRSRMSRLLTWQPILMPREQLPTVGILIPAKDEAGAISRCLDSVITQDYPFKQIIAIDDRSSDGTEKILDQFAQRGQLQAIHIHDLPPGWLGKSHALHVAAKLLSTEWLLFVDSDVTLKPAALSTALSIALERKYDAVSILTRLECHTFLERWLLPLLAMAWSVMHTISWTNEDSRKTKAAANGQFFLIRRSAYEAVGGHEAVKDSIVEDVELMRLLKSREFKVRFYLGSHLATTRMHATWRQIVQGWSRIYAGTARRRPWRLIAAGIFLVVSVLSIYPAIAWGIYELFSLHQPMWLIAAAIHFTLSSAYLAMIYRWSGNPAKLTFLAPISAGAILIVFGHALRACQTGKIVWRNSKISTK